MKSKVYFVAGASLFILSGALAGSAATLAILNRFTYGKTTKAVIDEIIERGTDWANGVLGLDDFDSTTTRTYQYSKENPSCDSPSDS